jgi:hypothetical protein
MESWARVILLLLAVALLINVANGTWREWLKAKFVGAG